MLNFLGWCIIIILSSFLLFIGVAFIGVMDQHNVKAGGNVILPWNAPK